MNLKKMTLATVGSLAISLPAFAGMLDGYNAAWDTGWYVGLGANVDSQQLMDTRGGVTQFKSSTFPRVDQRSADAGFDLYVGRDVSNYFAGELGFTWVGDMNFRVKDDGGDKAQDIKVKDQWNIHLVGKGTLPLGDYVGVFAKLGAAYMQSDQRFKDVDPSISTFTETTHGFALTYGVGIQATYEQFGVRGEYNVLRPAENVRDDFYVSDIISANVFYKFM